MIRGLHAFHIYATQYWVEYLLSVASTTDGINTGSHFVAQSSRLAEILNELSADATNPRRIDGGQLRDSRLEALKPYPNLYGAVSAILAQRKHQHLEEPDVGIITLPSLTFRL